VIGCSDSPGAPLLRAAARRRGRWVGHLAVRRQPVHRGPLLPGSHRIAIAIPQLLPHAADTL